VARSGTLAAFPTSAIERRGEFALEARLEGTGQLMAKLLKIAAGVKSGREIKGRDS
jgi:hypothetical protein